MTAEQLEIEQEEIYISDPYENTKSTNKGSVSSCGAMSSVEAVPFYPRKTSFNTFGANSENDQSEDASYYDQFGSIKDQIQYQTKFLPNQRFKRVYKVDQAHAGNNPFAFQDNGRIMSKDYKIKIKTELCRTFQQEGSCPYGDTCAFAHGEGELQKKKHVPSRYKTKLCQQFHENKYCPYGNRCQFIHSTTLNELQKKQENDNSDNEGSAHDLKSFLSHRQILKDNIECLKQRLTSSQNPYLNEFNLIYKDVVTRLPVFEAITSEPVEPMQDNISKVHDQRKLQLEKEYAILEAQLQANLRAQAEFKARQYAMQKAARRHESYASRPALQQINDYQAPKYL